MCKRGLMSCAFARRSLSSREWLLKQCKCYIPSTSESEVLLELHEVVHDVALGANPGPVIAPHLFL